MNKISFLLLGALAGVLILIFAPKAARPLGIAVNEAQYASSSVTESTVSCGSAGASGTGTLIVNSTPGRLLFEALNTAANPVMLCRRSNGCTATSSIQLNASGTVGFSFHQQDDYVGPYSCVGVNTTTTIDYTQGL